MDYKTSGDRQRELVSRLRNKTEKKKPRSLYARAIEKLGGGRYLDLDKETQFTEAWMLLVIILTILGLVLKLDFLLAAALTLLVIAAASWLWNNLSLFGLRYSRHLSETRAFAGETVELTLEVRNNKPLPLTWLQIIDVFPGYLPVNGKDIIINPSTNQGEFTTFWMPSAFQSLRRSFKVECTTRGYHAYGPVTINTGDGFGLFSRKVTRRDRQHLIVYPRIYSVEELHLPAENPFGIRGARRKLFEDPMRTIGIREWQAADSLRRVHWKASARHQKMLSRLYESSEEPQVLIFLNVATLRRSWEGNIPELLERTISVAGSLAAVCADTRLPVGLIANGFLPGSDQPIRLLPGRSPNQLMRILELLAAVTHFSAQPIEELLLQEALGLPWGTTLLIVTAIAHDDLLAALLDLKRSGRQVVLFTLAEKPPIRELPGIVVYHLPHLIEDLIAPEEVG